MTSLQDAYGTQELAKRAVKSQAQAMAAAATTLPPQVMHQPISPPPPPPAPMMYYSHEQTPPPQTQPELSPEEILLGYIKQLIGNSESYLSSKIDNIELDTESEKEKKILIIVSIVLGVTVLILLGGIAISVHSTKKFKKWQDQLGEEVIKQTADLDDMIAKIK